MVRGRLVEAERNLMALRALAHELYSSSWLFALVRWAEFEQARAAREPRKALFCSQAMANAARRAQHVSMQKVATRLARKIGPIGCQ
jgi:hypothetical protein